MSNSNRYELWETVLCERDAAESGFHPVAEQSRLVANGANLGVIATHARTAAARQFIDADDIGILCASASYQVMASIQGGLLSPVACMTVDRAGVVRTTNIQKPGSAKGDAEKGSV